MFKPDLSLVRILSSADHSLHPLSWRLRREQIRHEHESNIIEEKRASLEIEQSQEHLRHQRESNLIEEARARIELEQKARGLAATRMLAN